VRSRAIIGADAVEEYVAVVKDRPVNAHLSGGETNFDRFLAEVR